MSAKWDHDELAADLAKHLNAPNRMVWTDMQMGPSGSPRPDVYTMQKSYTQPRPVSYEIKVSRSDFLSDVNAAKWQKYLDFSGGVIFAVPHGLITKAEVPFECGLIVRSENGWKTLKREKPGTGRPDFKAMMKMVIDGVNQVHGMPLPVELREATAYRAQKAIQRDRGKEVATLVGSSLHAKEQATYWKERADDAFEHYRKLEDEARERGRKSAEDMLARRERMLSDSKRDLLELLSLPEDASEHAIRGQVARMVEALRQDGAIQNMRRLVDHYRKIIKDMASNAEKLHPVEKLIEEFPTDLFQEDAA